ncbi:MAG: sodium/proton antiporter NhaB [Candidatus Nitrospinota bacterium M3_3B_026]
MKSLISAFSDNFMGYSPWWYERLIQAFLIVNPILLYTAGPFITGWVLMAQFIFTLAMALKCYPLQPGGLLAVEAIALGMATTEQVYEEVAHNFPVILLLMFMVAGIYFMKELLLFIFAIIFVKIRSKILLGLLFSFLGAFLSAFLDALTVTAVIIAVGTGFFSVYHKFASAKAPELEHDVTNDDLVEELHKMDLKNFRGFLRNILMHGAVGTALGGVTTLVGEPQNLLIAHEMGWHFYEFFMRMTPVTMPVLAVGLLTCALVEKLGWFGYGYIMPEPVRAVLREYEEKERVKMDTRHKARLAVQAVVGIILILALAFHVAEVGLIGLMVIIFLTAFNGVTEEHRIGRAFEEALPFTSLLVVFFAIVAIIHEQSLFRPVIDWTLSMEGHSQLIAFYIANGALSAISDNVFVATIYISEAKAAFESGLIDRDQLNLIAVAINTGTNIPSVATPNGQAAFLFLLTSSVAALIRLSYIRMVLLALPYTITMSVTGLLAVIFFL